MATSLRSTPVFRDHRLLIGGLMLALDRDKPAATVLWPDASAGPLKVLSNTSTGWIHDDCLFSPTSNGELVCLEAATGKPIWSNDKVTAQVGGASIHSAVIGETVFLYTHTGDLVRAKLSAAGYQEISRTRLLEPVSGMKAWASPAYANRHVFARNDKELICVSLAAEP